MTHALKNPPLGGNANKHKDDTRNTMKEMGVRRQEKVNGTKREIHKNDQTEAIQTLT